MKKYLIRIIGSLCILGSAVLMFVPGWIQAKGVDRRELRNMRADVSGICSEVADRLLYRIEMDDDFKDELKDYDLPYSQGRIKARFREIEDLTDELLNSTVSLEELFILSAKAPSIMQDMENLLDSDGADIFFDAAAYYTLYKGSHAIYDPSDNYNQELVDYNAEAIEDATQDAVDVISEFSFLLIVPAMVISLILTLAAASAVTHICNKGRGLKYVFGVILIVMVAGICVALSLTSNMIADLLAAAPAFEDMKLSITAAPFFAIALMLVPGVLDIVFERKKKQVAEQVQSAES